MPGRPAAEGRFGHSFNLRDNWGSGGTGCLRVLPVRSARLRWRQLGHELLHLIQRELGRRLLGRTARGAGAGHAHLQFRHGAFDFKLLAVCGTVRGDDVVLQQGNLVALQILLEQRLGVLAKRTGVTCSRMRIYSLRISAARGIEAGSREHRPDNGLQRIRQDRRTANRRSSARPRPGAGRRRSWSIWAISYSACC